MKPIVTKKKTFATPITNVSTQAYICPPKQLKLASIIPPQRGFYNKKIAYAI